MKILTHFVLFVWLVASVIQATHPFDLLEPFDGVEFYYDEELFPSATAAPELTGSSSVNEDWCFEYDEIRFQLDALNIRINVAKRNQELFGNFATNLLKFINARLLPAGHPPYTAGEMGKLSSLTWTLPPEVFAPYHLLIRDLKDISAHTNARIRADLDAILNQEGIVTNMDKTILLARLMVDVKGLRDENSIELDSHSQIKNELLEKIFDHDEDIRACFKHRIAGADSVLLDLETRREYEISLNVKYEAIRDIIVKTIEKLSLRPQGRENVSSELRMVCLESARAILFDGAPSPHTLSSLPQFLKRSLKQKNLNFLTAWIDALDAIYEPNQGIIERIDNHKLHWMSAKLFAEKMIEQLNQDVREALDLLFAENK